MKTIIGRLLMAAPLLLCLAQSARAEAPAEKLIKSIDYRDLPLQDALRILADQTGLNVVATGEARKISVTLFLRNVTARAALEELCKTNDLAFKSDEASGIVRITTLQEFQRDVVTVREDKTEIFTLLYPNAVTIAVSVRDLFGSRVQVSLSTEGVEDESRDLEDRLSRFDIIDQRSQGLGLFGGGGTTGGSSFGGGSNNNSFSSSNVGGAGNNRFNTSQSNTNNSVTRRQEAQRQRASDLEKLTPEQAMAIQKIVDGKSGADYDKAMKPFRSREADINISLSRKNNLLMVRTSDMRALEEIRDLVKKLDVPTPMVMLEVRVLSIDLSDGFDSVFDYQFSDGVNNAAGFSPGTIQPPASDFLNGDLRKAASLTPGGAGLRTGDLMFQYVNESFRARIQMLEMKNKITTLANPLLLTANNEVSRLFVGEERPIIRNISSQTVVNDNAVTSVPNTTVEFRPVGTTLLITPNINSDRTVTLRILQENSTINPQAATIPVVTSNGGVQDQSVDVVATRTVSGTVIAKDKLMLAIGGLIEDGVRDQRAQVPVLGKIPVLGIPFRRQDTGRTRRELIVLCRPYVLSTPADAQAISQDLLDRLSLHPSAQGADMKAFEKREVLLPQPPKNQKESIFRLDHVKNADD